MYSSLSLSSQWHLLNTLSLHNGTYSPLSLYNGMYSSFSPFTTALTHHSLHTPRAGSSQCRCLSCAPPPPPPSPWGAAPRLSAMLSHRSKSLVPLCLRLGQAEIWLWGFPSTNAQKIFCHSITVSSVLKTPPHSGYDGLDSTCVFESPCCFSRNQVHAHCWHEAGQPTQSLLFLSNTAGMMSIPEVRFSPSKPSKQWPHHNMNMKDWWFNLK